MTGPLAGKTVVEFAAIGPAPFCCMMLADMGARESVVVNLRDPGVAVALDLAAAADVLVEGFRPGVAERLGLGPDDCLARNPRLVYGRITGWGQDGPLARAAGHDLNYVALSGALHAMGRADAPPMPPGPAWARSSTPRWWRAPRS